MSRAAGQRRGGPGSGLPEGGAGAGLFVEYAHACLWASVAPVRVGVCAYTCLEESCSVALA